MGVLKIHGHAIAPLVRLVAQVCKEKEIAYEVVNVAVYKGEHKTPAFKKFHPFGQVPYIDDDGFVLYEARAICRYLVKKHDGTGTPGLLPQSDAKDEALFEQAAHRGLPEDEARVKEYLEQLNANLDAYEDILGRHRYLAGQNVTLADLFHLPYGAIVIDELGCNVLENRPNVARWWKEISTRPAWLAVKHSA